MMMVIIMKLRLIRRIAKLNNLMVLILSRFNMNNASFNDSRKFLAPGLHISLRLQRYIYIMA